MSYTDADDRRSIMPTWAETLVDLYSASTVEELWGVLLTWHGSRSSSSWDEPFSLFTKFHGHDSADAVVTAALLCTDYRWRKASHRLIEQLAGCGVLTASRLDELADWFSGDALAIDLVAADTNEHSELRRPIWPPLRRWAARHEVQRGPHCWRELMAASTALSSSDGAATMAGVLDAASHITAEDLPAVVAAGLASGSGVVRLATLPALAALEGVEAALARARRDPSATVRAWKPPRLDRGDQRAATTPDAAAPRPARSPQRRSDDEPTLF